jgi:retron-type reverse transcriptase
LHKFVVRDPKTRTIHSSAFRDRVVYHALVNILEPIFEKIFIHHSYASRIDKGTHNAVKTFDKFKRKVSKNGQLINKAYDANSIQGYVLKADIKHYFETVDHEILLKIIKRKIRDDKVIWLIQQILGNFETEVKGKGMPLGNLTSQFFANVYLNELDYFVKHELKAKYYLRYVDDFVILHQNKEILEEFKGKVTEYLKNLKLELHFDKSKIIALREGITFLGYRIFYHYKLLRKSNLRKFKENFKEELYLYEKKSITREELDSSIQGWFGYAMLANTYKLRKNLTKITNEIMNGKLSENKIIEKDREEELEVLEICH